VGGDPAEREPDAGEPAARCPAGVPVRVNEGGGAGASRPEYDRNTGPLTGTAAAARLRPDARAAVAAVSFARSCDVSIAPAAVTASSRRTGATDETRLSTMPPGVHVCSLGTRRTACGSPRAGSSDPRTLRAAGCRGVVCASGWSGVHHRGGRTPASRYEFTRTPSGPASTRRTGTGRAVDAAKRVDELARLPMRAGRTRASGGPGSRIRRATW
jgi:hypothetical protein